MTEADIAQKQPIEVELESGKTYHWCSCGKSDTQPFCDGSHQGTDFEPMAFTAEEAKKVYLCACKRTGNSPFCDGAHKDL
ncbi:MAG: CDGSH iron-sulfur domain-containing protein [Rhodospirillales bacterium]